MIKYMTAREAAEALNLSTSYVTTYLLQTGKIKADKIQGRWFVDRESVKAYVPPTNTQPSVSNKGRIIPIKKDKGDLEKNRAIIQQQMEAVKAGKITPLVLDRGVSEL